MAIHDWTRVRPGTFHDFHLAWIAELRKALNRGILPRGFYALAEQSAGDVGPDVLTLRVGGPDAREAAPRPEGATAVTDAPPVVHTTAVANEHEVYAAKRRTLTIRYSGTDEIIAFVEILSPGNKDRRRSIERIVDKVYSAMVRGIHVLLVDILPPGASDPQGIHAAIWTEFDPGEYQPPSGRPLTLASYAAAAIPRAYVEPTSVGSTLPDMPLFIDEEYYVKVPLESTYLEAYSGVPERWRRVLEGTDPDPG